MTQARESLSLENTINFPCSLPQDFFVGTWLLTNDTHRADHELLLSACLLGVPLFSRWYNIYSCWNISLTCIPSFLFSILIRKENFPGFLWIKHPLSFSNVQFALGGIRVAVVAEDPRCCCSPTTTTTTEAPEGGRKLPFDLLSFLFEWHLQTASRHLCRWGCAQETCVSNIYNIYTWALAVLRRHDHTFRSDAGAPRVYTHK